MKNCVCICSVYKTELNNDEIISLNRFINVLFYRDIVFVAPKSFNTEEFLNHVTDETKNKYLSYHDKFIFEYFDDDWFTSGHTYNALLYTLDFYNRFKNDYRYMFMYQLDAFIFEDKLDYYLSKNYNFIGGYEGPLFHYEPLFHLFEKNNYKVFMNGGFNLRNIDYCINTINNHQEEANNIVNNKYIYIKSEDQFFSEHISQSIELNDLLNFSLADSYADIIFGLTHKYPFGCHGYHRSNFLVGLINKFLNNHYLY